MENITSEGEKELAVAVLKQAVSDYEKCMKTAKSNRKEAEGLVKFLNSKEFDLYADFLDIDKDDIRNELMKKFKNALVSVRKWRDILDDCLKEGGEMTKAEKIAMYKRVIGSCRKEITKLEANYGKEKKV